MAWKPVEDAPFRMSTGATDAASWFAIEGITHEQCLKVLTFTVDMLVAYRQGQRDEDEDAAQAAKTSSEQDPAQPPSTQDRPDGFDPVETDAREPSGPVLMASKPASAGLDDVRGSEAPYETPPLTAPTRSETEDSR